MPAYDGQEEPRAGASHAAPPTVPLRNRVTPFSRIEATSARGLFMGQRGILHDGARRLTSERWRHKNWISCVLEYRGNRRTVMTPHKFTELFFLDDAVALAAGHRPCALCRRADYTAFVRAWARASGQPPRAPLLDAALHRERVAIMRGERPRVRAGALPDGAFACDADGRAYLKRGELLLEWSHHGYTAARRARPGEQLELLTPPATVEVLRAGFRPLCHPSAERFGAAG